MPRSRRSKKRSRRSKKLSPKRQKSVRRSRTSKVARYRAHEQVIDLKGYQQQDLTIVHLRFVTNQRKANDPNVWTKFMLDGTVLCEAVVVMHYTLDPENPQNEFVILLNASDEITPLLGRLIRNINTKWVFAIDPPPMVIIGNTTIKFQLTDRPAWEEMHDFGVSFYPNPSYVINFSLQRAVQSMEDKEIKQLIEALSGKDIEQILKSWSGQTIDDMIKEVESQANSR